MQLVGAPLSWARVGSVLLLVAGVFGLPVHADTHFGSPAGSALESGDKARVGKRVGPELLYYLGSAVF